MMFDVADTFFYVRVILIKILGKFRAVWQHLELKERMKNKCNFDVSHPARTRANL